MSEITSNGTKKRKLTTKSCERDAAIDDLPNETLPPKAHGRCATSVAQAAQPIENARLDTEFVLAELSRLREQVAKLENGNTAGLKTESGSLAVIDLTDDDEVLSPVKREYRSNDSDVTNVLFEVTPVPEMAESVQNVSEFQNTVQMPTIMRRMPLTQDLHLPPQPHTKFEYRFLRDSLGGRRITDGWYSSNGSTEAFANIGPYGLMNREFDPLLPCLPGVHGAQISPCLPPNKIGQTFPLFISDIGDSQFQYYGTYEVMVSDRLGHNQMLELPEQIKRHWARKLGAGSAHGSKASPIIYALRYMWPRKECGWWNAENDSYTDQEGSEMESIDSMSRTITKEEAQDITEGVVMAAFDRPDLDDPPGVSLYYEYLKCVGYDLELYHTLVTNMNEL
ncbi:uncharacterized protein EAE98_012099 [Botrytis deweyae]|uniref:DUF6697 domain-containing protein n=1 Tax=Botrytis deweyae TaxID=2478750 RepID=A0ABQ7I409_9HELO|nr:uncharacterized protein EAE98_012099 [Botrytis deweyae]KAF7910412.1 hypothetical protein EAE98_012099 [Botrytis deweyae]